MTSTYTGTFDARTVSAVFRVALAIATDNPIIAENGIKELSRFVRGSRKAELCKLFEKTGAGPAAEGSADANPVVELAAAPRTGVPVGTAGVDIADEGLYKFEFLVDQYGNVAKEPTHVEQLDEFVITDGLGAMLAVAEDFPKPSLAAAVRIRARFIVAGLVAIYCCLCILVITPLQVVFFSPAGLSPTSPWGSKESLRQLPPTRFASAPPLLAGVESRSHAIFGFSRILGGTRPPRSLSIQYWLAVGLWY